MHRIWLYFFNLDVFSTFRGLSLGVTHSLQFFSFLLKGGNVFSFPPPEEMVLNSLFYGDFHWVSQMCKSWKQAAQMNESQNWRKKKKTDLKINYFG